MTAPDDLIRRGDVERIISEAVVSRPIHDSPATADRPAWAVRNEIAAEIRALPADPVAEAAEAEIVRLRAIEAEAKTYLANMDYCFTAENLTVEDEGHRDASESRLRALLAKGGA